MKNKLIQWFRKIKIGIRNPKLAVSYLFRKRYKWSEDKYSGIKKKKYKTYSEYLKHQKSKLGLIKNPRLKEYDVKYRIELRKRLEEQNIVQSGMNVLCLAARVGTEVKSFLDFGCFAVGLDLNPGSENKYVVYGDFHDVQFPACSADVVFTNSLDHVLDFDKLIKEIKRVLKPQGFLILEIVKEEENGSSFNYYETASWEKIDDLLMYSLNLDLRL